MSVPEACEFCGKPYTLVEKFSVDYIALPTCDCEEKQTEAELDRRWGK